MAELVGVDRTTVGTWERGEYTPRPDQRASYAEAIGVTLEELAAMLSSVPASVGETPDWLVNYFPRAWQPAPGMRAEVFPWIFNLAKGAGRLLAHPCVRGLSVFRNSG